MKHPILTLIVLIVCLGFCGLALAEEEEEKKPAGLTKCTMDFSLQTWSVFYKSGKGKGFITCDNGQTAQAKLKLSGGGLTAGKGKIRDGRATFSEVFDISELFGSYVAAEATAGASKSASAQVMTKGEVSVSLTGKGAGVELGASIGKFTIKRIK